MDKGLPEILMVEDSDDDAELTMEALSEHKFANLIVRVGDGVQALDYLYRRGQFKDRASPDPLFLLLDLKMPKVSGLEVLRHMKETPKLASIPIVMLSSSSQELDLREAHRLGASAYVVKPVSFDEFTEVVKVIGKFWGMLNVLGTGADSPEKNFQQVES